MPMYYLNPKDSFATSITDQFYWGENIVVAPILQKEVQAEVCIYQKPTMCIISTKVQPLICKEL
jgi:alpha-glucosidase (family GH31 glycosyl hydrolase)